MTMTSEALEAATRQLVKARAGGARIPPFDAAISPKTLADAHAIEDATVLGSMSASPAGRWPRRSTASWRVA